MRNINVDALTRYDLEEQTKLFFRDRDVMVLPPGKYYVIGSGVVIDLDAMTCILSKIADKRRRKKQQ